MKIYTKKGDYGETSLFDGSKISKADVRLEAIGTVDELNAHIGMLRDQISQSNIDFSSQLIELQKQLFIIGSHLAASNIEVKKKLPKLKESYIQDMEQIIDRMDSELPKMNHFILPGGHVILSQCHISRTVCRRAERDSIKLMETFTCDPFIPKYLNRLSDLLFILCRYLSLKLNISETKWLPT